jgi:hypothetical protein
MPLDTRNRWFRRLALAAVAAAGLGVLTLPLASAKAQVYFGFGPGGFAVDIGVPAVDVGILAPYYYGAPYGYYYPHYYTRATTAGRPP